MASQEVLLALLLISLAFRSTYGQVSCSIEGQIRLFPVFSSLRINAGRVEICRNGVWGTIAADSISTPWSEKNAQVACIELGFTGGLNSVLQRTIPFSDRASSLVPVHLQRVTCLGNERNITDCPSSTSSSVDHLNDAYIVCRPGSDRDYSDVHQGGGPFSGDIRLFGDATNGRGAVQIYSTRLGWQGICPDIFWGGRDAEVICQDLGYQTGTVAAPITVSTLPGGEAVLSSSRLLYSANCPPSLPSSSNELPIGVCSFLMQQSASDCSLPDQVFATVRCSNAISESVRLFGGSHSRQGIVEIAYDGRWGVLCNGDFSVTDARSVCQGLGYGRDNAATMFLSSSSDIVRNESNLKPVWLNNVRCLTTDTDLPSCVREEDVIGYANCFGDRIAAVDCGTSNSSTSTSSTIGIVIGVLTAVFVIAILGWIFGRDWWNKRHTYSWYNTLTTPSTWCDCCECNFGGSSSWQASTTARATVSVEPATTSAYTGVGTTTSEPVVNNTFNLTRRPQEAPPEPEPEPSAPEPSDPGLSKAPPPSYHAATNFPAHNPQPGDLPPPYPGGPGAAYPPPTAPAAAVYPPPAGDVYPVAPSDAAYPPPTQPAASGTTELPYPASNLPYPD